MNVADTGELARLKPFPMATTASVRRCAMILVLSFSKKSCDCSCSVVWRELVGCSGRKSQPAGHRRVGRATHATKIPHGPLTHPAAVGRGVTRHFFAGPRRVAPALRFCRRPEADTRGEGEEHRSVRATSNIEARSHVP